MYIPAGLAVTAVLVVVLGRLLAIHPFARGQQGLLPQRQAPTVANTRQTN